MRGGLVNLNPVELTHAHPAQRGHVEQAFALPALAEQQFNAIVFKAAQFAVSGSTQGGIFALSLARAPTFAHAGSYALIPEAMHRPLRQRAVLTRHAGASARAFYAYLQQPAARAIFRRYGFALPGEALQ